MVPVVSQVADIQSMSGWHYHRRNGRIQNQWGVAFFLWDQAPPRKRET